MEAHQGRSGVIMRPILLVTALGLASACRAPEKSRYELETTVMSAPVVHLCDTWTGQVWYYSRSANRWEPLTPLEDSGD